MKTFIIYLINGGAHRVKDKQFKDIWELEDAISKREPIKCVKGWRPDSTRRIFDTALKVLEERLMPEEGENVLDMKIPNFGGDDHIWELQSALRERPKPATDYELKIQPEFLMAIQVQKVDK